MRRVPDLPTGERFGRWTVLTRVIKDHGKKRRYAYLCRCECGREKEVSRGNLVSGRSGGCFTCGSDSRRKRKRQPLTVGERSFRLVVVALLPKGQCRVRCDCGQETTILRGNFRHGGTRSCGCLNREAKTNLKTHGLTNQPLYKVWRGMIQRCHGTGDSQTAVRLYRDRGITVCAAWRESVETWIADMGPRPAGHSIDRIDNDLGYWCGKCEECVSLNRPANCRWATQTEQARNTRRNVWLEHDGRRMLAVDWARELGISRQRLEQRIKAGLEGERLFAPAHASAARMRGKRTTSPVLIYKGKRQTAAAWSVELGLSRATIAKRLSLKLPVELVLHQGIVRVAPSRKGVPRTVLQPYRCGRCGGVGHNQRTCVNQLQEAS